MKYGVSEVKGNLDRVQETNPTQRLPCDRAQGTNPQRLPCGRCESNLNSVTQHGDDNGTLLPVDYRKCSSDGTVP